ncbi:helix-turn-helix domain-containing protein [Streptomyces sp. NPDC101206]|uniref:helix-turn-helix domain-containing protein n=1 Tax=Streptomyces sp. NPDC101206 TaxID=3366128 RepID=UPI0038019491
MATPAEVAERRATVRQLAQGGASNRQIAAQLGISKDTVARDIAHWNAPPATPAERRARHLARADEAVRQASAAAQAVAAARPAYTLANDETARRWCAELRAAADQLAAAAAAFADYYPAATS